MRILFVSKDASGASLCHRLQNEGNDVKFCLHGKSKTYREVLDGMVAKIDDLEKGLKWVGKDGLVVFDYLGFGKMQDDLRKKGYSVVGGCEFGDKLEDDRQYGQKIFSAAGLKIKPSIGFTSISKAISFLEKNKGPWVIKQNDNANKTLNYVGKFSDNRDCISLLKNYRQNKNIKQDCARIDLQKKIEGVEVAVGRFFNGKNWAGPLNINFEHKNFFNNNLGPATYEMGTLMFYTEDENNKLYKQTLLKLESYLRKISFKGYADINCIVNEDGVFPLEATTRFGYPTIQLQMAIHESPWGDFLKAIADGENFDLKWKKGYGLVVLVAAPPFPFFRSHFTSLSPKGLPIDFKDNFNGKNFKHLHFEDVARKDKTKHYICTHTGFVLHVSDVGRTTEDARKKVYSIIDKIVVPKMYYREDIGLKFIREDRKKLKKWGWI